nr:hypothetical protein [Nesterenkonia natronophila]
MRQKTTNRTETLFGTRYNPKLNALNKFFYENSATTGIRLSECFSNLGRGFNVDCDSLTLTAESRFDDNGATQAALNVNGVFWCLSEPSFRGGHPSISKYPFSEYLIFYKQATRRCIGAHMAAEEDLAASLGCNCGIPSIPSHRRAIAFSGPGQNQSANISSTLDLFRNKEL